MNELILIEIWDVGNQVYIENSDEERIKVEVEG